MRNNIRAFRRNTRQQRDLVKAINASILFCVLMFVMSPVIRNDNGMRDYLIYGVNNPH